MKRLLIFVVMSMITVMIVTVAGLYFAFVALNQINSDEQVAEESPIVEEIEEAEVVVEVTEEVISEPEVAIEAIDDIIVVPEAPVATATPEIIE